MQIDVKRIFVLDGLQSHRLVLIHFFYWVKKFKLIIKIVCLSLVSLIVYDYLLCSTAPWLYLYYSRVLQCYIIKITIIAAVVIIIIMHK